MNTHLSPGLRKLPSDIDLDILESVSLLAETPSQGEITLSAPLTSTPLEAILNGDFEQNLEGWNTRGSTQLLNEQVQLDENDAYLSRLSRRFTVPEGANTLQFTLEEVIVIPIIFRSATVSVATREQDAPTLSLMVFIWNDYNLGNSPLALPYALIDRSKHTKQLS